MLRLDAERALEAERAKSGRPAANVMTPPVKRPDRITVAAIYGLAGALQADVLVNGERLHFRQGQAQARNAASGTGSGSFQLAKIDDLCVHLTRSGERTPRVACYAAGMAPAAGFPGSPGTSMTFPLGTQMLPPHGAAPGVPSIPK
ncbi:hypothetical protein [Pigmentiphaga litoralis]|uniref:hypothetical protein n=1 Tax=Pigmentiphaga litoralis TaxID=516702 RepID=UPI003B4341D1